MDEPLGVVAIDDEGVAFALTGEAAIDDGLVFAQLLVDDIHPALRGVVLTFQVLHVGQAVVALETAGEVLVECTTSSLGRRTVIHVGSHTEVSHQQSHGIALLGSVACVVNVDHVAPIIDTLFKIYADGYTRGHPVGVVDGVAAHAVLGALVVVEHLGGGGGCTPRETSARAVGGDGAEIVERRLLSPLGGEEHGHGFGEVGSAGADHAAGGLACLHLGLGDLTDGGEPPAEILVLRLLVVAGVGIAEYGGQQIVVGDHGKSAMVVAVDGVLLVGHELLHGCAWGFHFAREGAFLQCGGGSLHLLLLAAGFGENRV